MCKYLSSPDDFLMEPVGDLTVDDPATDISETIVTRRSSSSGLSSAASADSDTAQRNGSFQSTSPTVVSAISAGNCESATTSHSMIADLDPSCDEDEFIDVVTGEL